MSEENVVLTGLDGAVGRITLNRPRKFNCLSQAVAERLQGAIDAFVADDRVRAVLIDAKGDNFCTGADLAEATEVRQSAAATRDFIGRGHRALRALETAPLPVIGAVQGLCLAGGLELAMACDVIFAAATAEFGDQHSAYGLVPGWGGTQRLPRLVGVRRALDLMFSARWISAETARDWGLVNHVVPDGDLEQAALTYAHDLAAKSRGGLATMKRLGRHEWNTEIEAGLAAEEDQAAQALMSDDTAEGLAAFRERRKPDFP